MQEGEIPDGESGAGLIASDVRCLKTVKVKMCCCMLPARTQAENSGALLSGSKSCPNSFPGSSPAEKGEPLVDIKEDVGIFLVFWPTANSPSLFLSKNTLNIPTPFSSQGSSRCGFSTFSWLGDSLHSNSSLASDPIYLVKAVL